MRSKHLKNTTLLLSLLFISIIGFKGIGIYQAKKANYLSGANVVYKSGVVLGTTTEESAATIDFSKQIKQSSPLIFGGAHYAKLEHQDAWNQEAAVGVTSMRSDFYMDRYLPSNISLADYISNKNDIQNPAKWNQTEIAKIKNAYQEARKRNMKTIGLLTYATKWLTHSGTMFGVPKDWTVYEDIVKKSYILYRDDIDYLEIWNEPDLAFLDVTNSGMTKEEAYYQIVKHAIKAVREVDNSKNDGKKIKLGVGVMAIPTNTSFLERIFTDKDLINQVDFVSYHNYEHPEPSDGPIRNLLTKNNLSHLKVFQTEWAHSPDLKKPDLQVLSYQAIPYAGGKLIDFMNMGLEGANYFALQQIDPASPRGDEGYLGFYQLNGTSANLLPISRTWMLMSKTLSLGKGTNNIYQTTTNKKVSAWKNSENQYGFVLTNPSNSTTTYNVTIYNLPWSGKINVKSYVASVIYDGTKENGSVVIPSSNGTMTVKIVAPANSVVGVKLNSASFIDQLPSLK